MSDQKNIFSVAQITFAIKAKLEPVFRNIYVKGEISNLKRQSSGHIYFSLKDEQAQIQSVIFKGNTYSLERLPKDGDLVIVKAELSIYPPRGNYQLIVRQLNFQGAGELLYHLHQLKKMLQQRGWFDEENKSPLPKFPKKIGVVTSPTGAAIQDIINVLTRRHAGIHLILNPVKVQGEKSAEEIAQAIDDFNQHRLVDVIIVGRGGGSLEDLWAFNEEIVAKAIYESKIPIISAVGHETDISISDFVADKRAPTPSAAAEIVCLEKTQLQTTLSTYTATLKKTLTTKIIYYRSHLKRFQQHSAFTDPLYLLKTPMQKLDETKEDIADIFKQFLLRKRQSLELKTKQLQIADPSIKILYTKKVLSSYRDKVYTFLNQLIKTKKDKLLTLCSHLKSLDPKNLLKKGYSILFSEKDRSIILSSKTLKTKDKIIALTHDGIIKAIIEKIEEEGL